MWHRYMPLYKDGRPVAMVQIVGKDFFSLADVAHTDALSSLLCATPRHACGITAAALVAPLHSAGALVRGEVSPGADVAGVSPVPVQMWQG